MRNFFRFIAGATRLWLRGGGAYWAWMAFLVILIVQGAFAYADQFKTGLILTNMRDPIAWGFYIANFTFLVGVAAAAVMLVIPAYIYNWKPIKEVVIFGELLAIATIIMCLLFVIVDMGHPERLWHLIPGIGNMNLPSSLLAWDATVLNIYLLLNICIAVHLLYRAFLRRDYNHRLVTVLVLLSIPSAVSIHTVTAFLYNGMPGRPYWNASILAPRFLASAFCSGPAILLVLFQVLRKTTRFEIKDEALHKIAELMAYAMGVNLFLLGAEVFKEYYSNTEHLVHMQYLFFGLHGEPSPIAGYAWLSVVLGVLSFVIFLIPRARRHPVTMNAGCVMIYTSVYIEKGVALLGPGFIPDVLGQVCPYFPSVTEFRIAIGVFGAGFLIFTMFIKVAVGILFEQFTVQSLSPSGSAAGNLAPSEA